MEGIILPLEYSQLQFSSLDIYLDNVISKGKYSSVYGAKCDNFPCVGKFLHCPGATSEIISRIEVECQLICAVKHPNIVQCLGTAWNAIKDRPILLLEFMDETLTQFIDRFNPRTIPHYIKVNICSDVALALAYLNRNKIIHGCLSGNNVMMVGETRAKVTDFWNMKLRGIYPDARPLGNSTQDHAFMAPELRSPRHACSTESDIFSFGVLVIYVDTQSFPSPIVEGSRREMNGRQKDIEKMTTKSPAFRFMAAKCLQNKPAERPKFESICRDLATIKENVAYGQSKHESRLRCGYLEQRLESFRSNLQQCIEDKKRIEREMALMDNRHSIESENLSMENNKLERIHRESDSLNKHLILMVESQRQELEMLQTQMSRSTGPIDQPDSGEVAANDEAGTSIPSEFIPQVCRPGIIPSDDVILKEKMGEGNLGVVYRATWNSQDVAFKKLSNQDFPGRLKNDLKSEMLKLCKLTHSNIVMFYGAVLEDGSVGWVMELLTKRSLFQAILIDGEQFTETKLKNTIRQISSGLEYLHSKGIVHSNLKSKNVLLDTQSIAKIINYGPKCMYRNSNSSYKLTGEFTARYAAPEILRNDLLSDQMLKMADMYSLAILIFEVLGAEEPYESLNPRQLEVKVGKEGLRPPIHSIGLSQPVVVIIEKCWDKKTENRASAQEFVNTWKRIETLFS